MKTVTDIWIYKEELLRIVYICVCDQPVSPFPVLDICILSLVTDNLNSGVSEWRIACGLMSHLILNGGQSVCSTAATGASINYHQINHFWRFLTWNQSPTGSGVADEVNKSEHRDDNGHRRKPEVWDWNRSFLARHGDLPIVSFLDLQENMFTRKPRLCLERGVKDSTAWRRQLVLSPQIQLMIKEYQRNEQKHQLSAIVVITQLA